jgi:hypothetical protein
MYIPVSNVLECAVASFVINAFRRYVFMKCIMYICIK